jgi:bacillithiol biosynthesis cysteine-adding enzyme BshC
MHSGCIRHSDLPGATRLFLDFVYQWDRVAPFFEYPYQDIESYADCARKLVYPDRRRQAMLAALREQNEPSPQLELLGKPSTVAVVTGQQVGLFSGPCYTIYKALTAARLAADLSERGIPAVAVFWLATEDHDFAEVNHCWLFNDQHTPVNLRVQSPEPDHRPVGDVSIAEFPVAALRQTLAGFPFGDRVSALVEESYHAGKTMGAAFVDLLRKLTGGLGLVFLDPMSEAVRQIAAPLIRDAVEAAPELTESVLERNLELDRTGYHAQVHFEPKTSLFFLLDRGHRLGLKRSGDRYVGDSIRMSAAELASRAEQVSPSALLRPVVQDYLLPTVAQVGGPAEVAYLAQSQALYRALGRPTPVVVPRTGFTLLDARSAKLLDRYQLSLGDFFDGSEAFREKISRRLVPPGVQASMETAQSQATRLLDEFEEELRTFDPTLTAALNKSRTKIFYQFSKIAGKVARETFHRDQRAQAEAAYLFNLVYPNRHLQERVYTILPFLARHGLELIDRLRESTGVSCRDHHLVTV